MGQLRTTIAADACFVREMPGDFMFYIAKQRDNDFGLQVNRKKVSHPEGGDQNCCATSTLDPFTRSSDQLPKFCLAGAGLC